MEKAPAEKCCACLPVKLGIRLMGAVDIIFWVMAAHSGDIIRFALFMLSSSCFALLCQKDSQDRRRNFFFVYTACRIIMLLIFAGSIYSQFF